MISRLDSLLLLFGINIGKTVLSIRYMPNFIVDFFRFRSLSREAGNDFKFGKIYPCLGEKSSESGDAKGHYFHQDLYVAQRIYTNKPERHIDIGSRVDGFVAHVASFREIEVIDIRSLDINISNIKFIQGDLMDELPVSLQLASDSVSCLHALEHFGLGRYGDSMDINGHLRGFANLTLLVKKGGTLYLSVPIGTQRIEFNAHRVFSILGLLEMFQDSFSVKAFSYVDDAGDFHKNASIEPQHIQENYGCHYGCGIFELTRL